MLLQATVVSVSCIAPKHEQHDAYMHCTTVTIGSSKSKMMGTHAYLAASSSDYTHCLCCSSTPVYSSFQYMGQATR